MTAVLNATKILAVLVAQPSYVGDRSESPAAREELLRPVAEAIAEVARDDLEAAALISLGWHETKWSRAVLEGRCSDLGRLACDRGKARGGWQVHAWCVATDVEGEARCALRALRYGRAHCTNGWLGAFAATRGTTSCTSREGAVRVHDMRIALERMRKAAP